MVSVAPTAELDAVNDLFLLIARQPLTAFTVGPAVPSVQEFQARALIRKWNTWIQQAKDWKANYTEKVAFTTVGTKIPLHTAGSPQLMNIARIVLNDVNPPYPRGAFDVEIRKDTVTGDWSVYNVTLGTFVFTASSTIYLDVTYLLDFDVLPQPFRTYITEKAKLEFVPAAKADPNLQSISKYLIDEAWDQLCQDHAYKGGTKSFARIRRRRTVYDTYDAARIIIDPGPMIEPAS